MFDALFFDLDGTLIDTESVALMAKRRFFHDRGLEVEDAFLFSLVGKDKPTVSTLIRNRFPTIDLRAMAIETTRIFEERISAGLTLKPGAAELLQATSHLPRALVTSSEREAAQRKLKLAGLEQVFQAVITLDDVSEAKPAPAPYLLAAERLSVAPARALVFEDSEAGAQAAYRAGCTVVQIPDFVPATGEWAHHVVRDMTEAAKILGLAA